MGTVVDYPGNTLAAVPRPRGESATIIILPVIRLEPADRDWQCRRAINKAEEHKGE